MAIATEDLDRVGDFVTTIITIAEEQQQQIAATQNGKLLMLAKHSASWLGVFLALTGSALLVIKLEPYVRTQPKFEDQNVDGLEVLLKNITNNIESESFDFGCNKNACWRSCYVNDNTISQTWCFSSPNPNNREYERCETNTDCKSNWECLDLCHD